MTIIQNHENNICTPSYHYNGFVVTHTIVKEDAG